MTTGIPNTFGPDAIAQMVWLDQNFQAGLVTIPTITALRANTLQITQCYILGYSANSDGGEGAFVVVPSDATSLDNGGTIIVDAANNRWYRLTGGQAYSIGWFGASPISADNQSSINNALAAAAGKSVYIPPNSYTTSGAHSAASNTSVFGPGTLRMRSGSGNSTIFRITTSNVNIDGVKFDLSTVSGAGNSFAVIMDVGSNTVNVQNCYSLNGCILAFTSGAGTPPTNIIITNNVISAGNAGGSSAAGIEINSGSTHWIISNNTVFNCGGAGIASFTGGTTYGEISGNSVFGNANDGIGVFGGGFVTISDNRSSTNGGSGINVNQDVGGAGPAAISVVNNVCAKNIFDGIDVTNTANSAVTVMRATVSGNVCETNGSSGVGVGVFIQNVSMAAINGNTINFNNLQGIAVNVSDMCNLTGNILLSNNTSMQGNPGIEISNSSHCTITGNISTNSGSGNTQTYGITTVGTADFNCIIGNVTLSNATSGMSLSGSHNQVGFNV